MKVLEKAITPEGIDIQIEDWAQDYSCFKCCSIGAYPIAKNSSKYKWVESGRSFRLDINGFNSNEEVKQAFNDLISGIKQIADFSNQFRNGDEDKYYMGLITSYDKF